MVVPDEGVGVEVNSEAILVPQGHPASLICFIPVYDLVVFTRLQIAECASRDVLRELHKTLMTGYEPSLRPVNDTSKPVIVGYRFTPTISVLVSIYLSF